LGIALWRAAPLTPGRFAVPAAPLNEIATRHAPQRAPHHQEAAGNPVRSRGSVISLSRRDLKLSRMAQHTSSVDGVCREAALILMKPVMPKFIFGIHTKDGRFIERVVDALNEAAARKLALEGPADEEIRLCMADAELEGDPKEGRP
jgi:hypothetical protein